MLLGLLFIAVALVVLEKLNITKFYTKPSSSINSTATGEIPSARPTNTVDYSTPSNPQTPVDTHKGDTPLPSPMNQNLSVTITRIAKSYDQKNYLFKAVVGGATSGRCTVNVSKDGQTVSDTGSLGPIESELSCLDLSIPADTLAAGTWLAVVTATDSAGAKTTATQEFSVE